MHTTFSCRECGHVWDSEGTPHSECPNCEEQGTVTAVDGKCTHMNVAIEWRLVSASTLYEPAEYEGRATCNDCGETMEPEDVDPEATCHATLGYCPRRVPTQAPHEFYD